MILPKFYFKYAKQRTRNPDTGERKIVYFPKIPCRFINGRFMKAENGILDSGADGCTISMKIAEELHLDLKKAKPMSVVGDEKVDAFKANLELIIGSGRRTDPIPIEVRVPAKGYTPPLIGRSPVFELYEITFIEAELKINMIPYNSN